ncbi:hypothetical protein DYB32_007107 [Aphanomyces invadans]|uniref:MSP domain-containing protein n=1 Tax=Aphanomyces invadans TaxID=157072 RepID=A0A418APS0_9STRA|nr:hypothetical protein DYB32_007107 [Aphanomyces invadans]
MQGRRMSVDSSTNTAWTLTVDESWLVPPTCVSILPSSNFTLDGNILGDKHTITLVNSSPSRHIVYKLKVPSKCRSWYAITPNQGILRPNESLPIVVEVAAAAPASVLEAMPLHSSTTIEHAFRLEMIFATDAVVDQLEYLDYCEQHRVQITLWEKALPSSVQHSMVHCKVHCSRLACLDTSVLQHHLDRSQQTDDDKRRREHRGSLSCLTRRQAHGASLVLTNTSPSNTLMYKIKSNCGLTATPSFGFINPYGSIAVHVTPRRHATNKNDLLRIESMPAVDVDTHVKRDQSRTLDDIRRIVQAAWPTIDPQFKTTQTMYPWEGDARRVLPSVHLFASERSAGKTVETPYGPLTVKLFSVDAARVMDYVFLAVSGSFALEHAEAIAAPGGAIVIDNSSAFRMEARVPLVIPEINGDTIGSRRLIANPNCTTAVAAMALWPLHCHFKIEKMIVSTYQAASGAGIEGMTELIESTKASLNGAAPSNAVFAHPLAFNVIPHIDAFQPNGYTKEEMKVTWETNKIFGESTMKISCTAVRIPILRAHSEAITIQTARPITADAARYSPCIGVCLMYVVEISRELLRQADGVDLVDDPANKVYPMPLNATAKYNVEVGRIRQSVVFDDHGLDLFVSGDQLLRGAALNAVLIAEYIAKPYPSKFTKQ